MVEYRTVRTQGALHDLAAKCSKYAREGWRVIWVAHTENPGYEALLERDVDICEQQMIIQLLKEMIRSIDKELGLS